MRTHLTVIISSAFLFLSFFLMPASKAFSQEPTANRTLTGIVTDADGTPVHGAFIKVKKSNTNTLSAKNGTFDIRVEDGDTLVITHVGYVGQQVAVRKLTTLKIMLEIKEKTLDDVIVIGYGTVKKKDATGAVGAVKMADLKKAPVPSFDQALAGRVAGVQVTSGEDQPGSDMSIVIRGGNSLTQSNSPLYVIDGFPIEDFSSAALNPADIASITILKDASATAIYGSRGANGVIIIETKKGTIGKAVISYDGYVGSQKVGNTMELMSPYEFVGYQLERDPVNMTPLYLTTPGLTLDDYKSVEAIDWQDMVFRNGLMQNHNISLSGGNNQTRYSVSGSLFDQKGVVLNSGYKRYQGRIALNQVVNSKLRVNVSLNYTKDKNYGQLSSEAQASSNAYATYLLYQVWGYRPLVAGNEGFDIYNDLVDPETNDNRLNPVISLNNEVRQQARTNLLVNANLVYNITKDLELNIRGGINNRMIKDESFYNKKTRRGYPSPSNPDGVNGAVSFRQLNDWMNENTITYKKQFNTQHQFDATAGFTLQGFTTDQYGYEAIQVPNEELGLSGMDQGLASSLASIKSDNALVSYLGRVNYTLNSRYLFTASFRADGSSKFSADNRWGYFPSGAIGWRMIEEKFLRKLKFISDSKLRISYGQTGNNRVSDFARFSALSLPISAFYSFNNQTPQPGISPNNLGNHELKWEKTAQVDIGYELSLFKSRVNLIVDLYRKTTNDLLLDANIPASSGYTGVYKNIGRIRNDGLEITLNTVNVKSGSFQWSSDFNISFNKNKVMALSEGEESLLSGVTWTGDYNSSFLYMTKIGGPATAFYGYQWEGVYQYGDFDKLANGAYSLKLTVPTNGSARANIQPGDVKYKDQNGDGVVNDKDRVVIGRALPLYSGGFNNNFTYKGFSLNLFLQYSYGNDIMNANRILYEGNPFSRSSLNQFKTYADRWTPDNPSNEYYRIGGQGPTGVYSSRTIEDGSYLRLKTASLSWDFPAAMLKKWKMQNLQVYVSGQNLLTWTNYSGMDPEVSVRNTTLTPGFDYSAYPRSRTITFGVKATF
jgi:TonB-linked SusC/RagA family outer membrane protein